MTYQNSTQAGSGKQKLVEREASRLNDDRVVEMFERYQRDLYHFLLGILRDDSAANDAVQTTLSKLIDQGGGVAPDSLRSWLFRVAFSVAMENRRRHSLETRHQEQVAIWKSAHRKEEMANEVIREEQAEIVRRALSQLPPEQEQVVRLRIYENLKFIEIAEQLQIPLGTVLTRMRSGLSKLKISLGTENES